MVTPATSNAQSAAIDTVGLIKSYRGMTALNGLTMTVPRGEVFGFLGPNGAGKTTAVKLLLGLTRPTAGEGWVLGAPMGHRQTRRQIGYLPELFRYQDWLTAREVLALHCDLAGVPRPDRAREIADALATVGLSGRAGDRVGTYSKGMQQRLGLAVALLGRPALVLLDEPTSALDPVGRHDVRGILHALKERGSTVFLNSHLLTEVEHVCDRIAVIDRGRVIALGGMSEVLGATRAVRLRVTGLSPLVDATLRRHGEVSRADGWVMLRDIEAEAVPDLIADLVRLGARVYAVEPRHQTLEERFLELLRGDEHAAADDSAPHSA